MNALRRPTAPSPLQAIAVAAIVAGAALLLLPLPVVLRGVIALPLVLLAPGWLTMAAIFPGRAFDPVLRVLSALALSIAIAILTGIFLAGFGVRLGETPFTIMAALEVAVAALAAERSGAALWLPRLSWTMTSVLLVAAGAISFLAFATARQTPTVRSGAITPYTALWTARDSRKSFRVGLISGELKKTRYELDVVSRGTRLRRMKLALRPGQQWEATFLAVGDAPGRLRVQLRRAAETRLYREVDVPR
jgi:hypothetical protein